MAEPRPTYTREEMDAILKRAIERQQARAEEIPHEDLVAAAGEVGIPREEVEAAARDLEAEKAKRSPPGSAPAEPSPPPNMAPADEGHERALRRWNRRAMTFFALGMFFFFIGHETGADWWIWPVLGMAVSLTIQAARDGLLFFGMRALDEPGERRSEKRVSRRERRQMRRSERLAEFEQKVAIGADALVRIIEEAKGVKTRLESAERAHRARYATPADERPRPREQPEQGPRVLVTPPPVRVDTKEGDEVEREREAGPGERQRTRGA